MTDTPVSPSYQRRAVPSVDDLLLIDRPAAVPPAGDSPAGDSNKIIADAKHRPVWPAVLSAFVLGAGLSAASFYVGTQTSNEVAAANPLTTPISLPASETANNSIPLPNSDPAIPAVPLGNQPVAAVAALLGPSVVQVETDRGLGSGVVYADGLVITNHHVIDGASQIRVRTSDGRTFESDLLGSDRRNDIAVLDIAVVENGTDHEALPVGTLALGQDLAVGEMTVAIGSPFQLQQTVTAGIVSAVNRPVPNNGGTGMTAMIQTDAPINPGNSGGALANAAGEVIGINTSIRTDGTSNSNVGIGFAVPIDTAFNVAERIVNGQSLDAGVLGVQANTAPDDEIGVAVGQVLPDGAAAQAGLIDGDRVLTINGAPVTAFSELVGLVQSQFAGDTIELVVVRNATTLTLTPTLR